MSFAQILSGIDTGGLRPRTWLCVEGGFAREELKEALLRAGRGFVGEVVLRPQDLALRIVSAARGGPALTGDHVPGPLGRQEIFRLLLSEPRISVGMPELKRLRRQGTFFRKLDRTFQSARLAFSHEEEEALYRERLLARIGPNPVREELGKLSRAYEAWLEASDAWDLPMLFREAARVLSAGELVLRDFPAEIVHFSTQSPQSLELTFWEALGRRLPVRRVGPLGEGAPAPDFAARDAAWDRWHSLDDAADGLAEHLAALPAEELERQAILIPDHPSVRRSITRALGTRNVPLADPRDPTRLRWDENLKWALLPLETVARGFERQKTISWLRAQHAGSSDLTGWVNEINARGIRQGLGAYAGGKLGAVHAGLEGLLARFGGKQLCLELGEAHLAYLRETLGEAIGQNAEIQWVIPFFEAAWREFVADTARVGQGSRRAPALFWLERLQARLADATPPVDRLRARAGVRLSRLGQVPLRAYGTLWLFGLPPQWLGGDGAGDYWYSERDREVLSGEFNVRSVIQLRRERVAALRSWVEVTDSVAVVDAHYDWDGRERESLLPVLRELGLAVSPGAVPRERGSHPRWSPSYGALRPVPPLEFTLPPLAEIGARRDLRATEIDHYSRCAFRGLAAGRWRLWDTREPEADLWPDVKGNILHRAAGLLLASRDEVGQFSRLPADALEEAWSLERPKGLLRGPRLVRYVKAKLVTVLEAFCEAERDYVKRAGTRVSSVEGPTLRLEYPDIAIGGIPDRVDEHPDGLFILDYKTSSSLPKGKEMVEQGYRLQLPFYALAVQKQLGKPVIGVQFVELNRKAGRGNGIFFKRHNGKEPGKLTNSRSKLSVLELEAADAWSQVEAQLLRHARDYSAGRFQVRPKKEQECRACPFDDLCGKKRLASAGVSVTADAGGEGVEGE